MPSSPFIDFHLRTRIVFGIGALSQLTRLAGGLGFTRTLVVGDQGMMAMGYVDTVAALLRDAGSTPSFFHGFGANPDSDMVEAGRRAGAAAGADSIVAIGGGSSLDCAKGINFVLTNGGTMRDYRGYGKATRPLLPMIGIPTTAGTGSEAQAYALISDAESHAKMACGDPKACFRVAILDPELTLSQPPALTATTGYDALSHAVESFVTTRRTAVSEVFSREAWRLLESSYERALEAPADLEARTAMLLGAHWAGVAIDQSMLGATHACANPLTAHYGVTHGIAIALMLPHVVRWNAAAPEVRDRYGVLLRLAGHVGWNDAGERLATRLDALATAGGLPRRLRELNIAPGGLAALADDAAGQWTGTFNPRPFDRDAALELYERAMD